MIKYYLTKGFRKIRWSAIKNSKIDRKAYISGGNTILNSEIGKYSYTSYNTTILYAKIGNYCSISSDCKIGGAGHPMSMVSTSPLFHNAKNVFRKHFAKHEFDPYTNLEIGNDVWIGQNVLIKSGVKIGNGAVVGMGAVVTKDIGPYEVWAGNPARLIKKRFDDETIGKLQELSWWDWEDKKIEKYADSFASIEKLNELIEENL